MGATPIRASKVLLQFARVAKLVDARDLKSLDQKSCGFDSRLAHQDNDEAQPRCFIGTARYAVVASTDILDNMATRKKQPSASAAKTRKKTSRKKQPTKRLAANRQPLRAIRGRVEAMRHRVASFLKRRPHRSFRLTRRRDYARSLKLPGYIAFTLYVNKVIREHRWTFRLVVALYAVIILLLGGLINQETYQQMADLLQEARDGLASLGINRLGEAGLLFGLAILGGPSEGAANQKMTFYFVLLLVWLCTVWLLREYLAGRRPRFRDGLYNSGAPIMSTMAILGIALIQLLPAGLFMLVYSVLSDSGLLVGGFGGMLVGLLAVAVACLVLYWWTSTIIALVIVTLPGMYPMKAVAAAGDIVVGRRLRILLRLLWGALVVLVAWMLLIIPVVFLQTLLSEKWQFLAGLPLAAIVAVFIAAGSVVWYASYVYLLYRKIVDDDAKPA